MSSIADKSPEEIQANFSKKVKKTNIIAMSSVSFFMNFASGMIVSSCNNFLIGQLECSSVFLGIVRGGSEGLGNLVKVIFGMLSDRMRNRKLFLIIGYGGMFILKPVFGLSALNLFTRSTKLFLYGFNHAIDRVLNAMRDGVRDASIYESSDQQRVGSSMGMRKFMACFGSFLGGIAAFFILKFFAKTNQSTVFSVMYFSTIIPVSISMFILVFYVKDLFQEKYKNQTKIEDEEFIVPSRNIIPGNLLISSLVALGIGIFLQRILSTIVNSFQWGTTQLLNIYLSTGASWMIKLKTIIYSFWTQLPYQATAIKVLSIVAIAMLVMELFFVKIYPNFFDKDSQRRNIFIWLNFIVFQMFGFLLTLCWSSLSPSFSIITALKMTFFQYGLNATIIIPLIILFRLVFYALYKKMQPTLEYYSKDLVKYDKIITLTFILAFSKYSDIFVFKHVIESCGWNVMYTPLLYAVLYLIFGIFAYILGRLSDGFLQKYSMFLLVTVNIVFNIVAATLNITHPMLRGFFSIIALISYGAYVGLTDSVLVSLVSKAIPVDRLLGTLLGLFYLLIGVGNTCASYFIGTVFVSTTQAYKMAVIPSILGFLFVLWNRKTLQENN